LRWNQIGAACLFALKPLTQLKELYLNDQTKLETKMKLGGEMGEMKLGGTRGVESLREALPACKVYVTEVTKTQYKERAKEEPKKCKCVIM